MRSGLRSAKNGKRKEKPLERKPATQDRTSLADASRVMLRIVVDAADAFYSVQPPDSDEAPLFLMQSLILEAGAPIVKRRVYEVLHLWEALGLVERMGKGVYRWHGEPGYRAFRARVLAAGDRMRCDAFVRSEVSKKGSSDPQRLALAVYYLFEHPGTLRMGETWSRINFRELCEEAAIEIRISGWERRYYDILNLFRVLSVARVRIAKSKQRCLMEWTPEAFDCTPRTDEELQVDEIDQITEQVRVGEAMAGLESLPGPSRGPGPSLKKPQVDIKPFVAKRPPVRSQRIVYRPSRLEDDDDYNERPSRTPADDEEGSTPVRPVKKRAVAKGASAALIWRPPAFTMSSDSSASSGAESPVSDKTIVCNTEAWSNFSQWASGDDTLPPLFDGDVLCLEAPLAGRSLSFSLAQ